MNERIRELAKQAGAQGIVNRDFIDVEKFAELIVQECAKFTFKYTSDEKNIQEYNKIGWDLLSGDLRDAIKEHFGVEE
jgi:hypothetical protein